MENVAFLQMQRIIDQDFSFIENLRKNEEE